MYISVNANVSDESGANVYVAAFENNVEVNLWKDNIETGQWDLAGLAVHLQPNVPSGNHSVTVSGNITHAYANLESSDLHNVDVDKQYYVYMYAIDARNNSVAMQYEYTVTIDVATTNIVSFDNFMRYPTNNPPLEGTFAQVRSAPPAPNVDYGGPLFRFHDSGTYTDWDSKLYGVLHVNPEESVITGNVYTIAVETATGLDNVAAFINDRLNETLVYQTSPMYNANIDISNEIIDRFYPNVDTGTSSANMEIGKTYHVYSMVQDIGFNKDVVKLNRIVQTGTPPNVSTVNVRVLKS